MSIFSGSRYEATNLIALIENNRTRVLFEDREPISLNDFEGEPLQTTVQEGTTIDGLAVKFYGQERLWWIIADVNDLFFPFELEIGSVLLIPPASFANRF